MSNWKLQVLFLALLVVSDAAAAATEMKDIACNVIKPIYETLKTIAPALVLLMFTYGAVKYALASDDPGGRKQAKNIMIHAIIAGLIIGIILWLMDDVLGLLSQDLKNCLGITA